MNDHLVRWDKEIKSYDIAVTEYGQRKADLEYRRAVVMETAKHEHEKLSQAAAEKIADADKEAYQLHREFRSAESTIAAKKERLKWCAAVADALRSEVATEREEARLYSENRSTP
ncbi:hypothetical protein ACSAGD_10550 [Paramicrobacterium sp. CJ85]|uniref:hypothetical protein n=1 Tax=Paramicrobacterium sp. CJ85 TaxID=3445355 RepID=UPI003F5D57D7